MKGEKAARAAIPCEGASLFDEAEGSSQAGAARADSSSAQRISHGAPDNDRWTASVLAGIDEAGLGPLLGPLSIGCSAFRVPRGRRDLWAALRSTCTDDVGDDRERLVVADSKLVFTRNPRGGRRLERTALTFIALRDRDRGCPATAREMLERMSHDVCAGGVSAVRADSTRASDFRAEPWCAHLDRPLPRHGRREEIESLALRLAECMSRAGIELESSGARLVPASDLNASFAETDNKSVTHWRATESLLVQLWRAHAEAGLDLTVDRHGGRMRYAPLLAETFSHCSIHVVLETPPRSEYVVIERAADRGASTDVRAPDLAPSFEASSGPRPPRRMRIAFAERAESASFAVALASCLAKYARELCMDAFNAYFESFQPGLKPTAGYLDDGRRWLAEAGPAIERSGIARRDLVRER